MIMCSFGPQSPLKTPVSLGVQDTLTVSLTAKDNDKGKRPHQAFVLLKEEDTGLEAPFPLSVRDTGKGNVKIVRNKLAAPIPLRPQSGTNCCIFQTQKDLPAQFFASSKPLHATVVIGSFGSSQGLVADAFDIDVKQDTLTPPPSIPESLRYGKKPQIHHIFKEDTKYAPTFLALIFMVAVGATLPIFLAAVSYTKVSEDSVLGTNSY